MNKYTSLKLSKLLAENGFEKESEMWWGNTIGQKDQTCWRLYTKEEKEIPDTAMEYYPAYDILNDLCVKYAKEMFGEKHSEDVAHIYHSGHCRLDASDNALLQVGILIRLDRQDEAEKYLWEHCLFNL